MNDFQVFPNSTGSVCSAVGGGEARWFCLTQSLSALTYDHHKLVWVCVVSAQKTVSSDSSRAQETPSNTQTHTTIWLKRRAEADLVESVTLKVCILTVMCSLCEQWDEQMKFSMLLLWGDVLSLQDYSKTTDPISNWNFVQGWGMTRARNHESLWSTSGSKCRSRMFCCFLYLCLMKPQVFALKHPVIQTHVNFHLPNLDIKHFHFVSSYIFTTLKDLLKTLFLSSEPE